MLGGLYSAGAGAEMGIVTGLGMDIGCGLTDNILPRAEGEASGLGVGGDRTLSSRECEEANGADLSDRAGVDGRTGGGEGVRSLTGSRGGSGVGSRGGGRD